MKKFNLSTLFTWALLLLLPLLSSAQYCIPGGEHEPEGISSFQFNSIVNYDSPYNQTCYTLYTPEQFTTTVTMGESYALQVSNPAILMDVFRMWIDLNNDGVFADSEMLLDEENSNGTVSAYITIPSHASYQGQRRLRIINGCRYEDFDACGWDGYHQGEAEDYTITITDSLVVPEYCIPMPADPTFPVENFKLNTLLNCQSGYPTSGYTHYPDSLFTTQLELGTSYAVYAGKSQYGVSGCFAVFIDYNDNHVFESVERVFQVSGGTYGMGFIKVPDDTTFVGNRRLRVRSSWAAAAINACDGVSSGETEDYQIQIIRALPDTDTIVPPATNRWRKVLELPEKQWAYGVKEHYDKGLLMMGTTDNDRIPFVAKTTWDGDTLWTRRYEPSYARYPVSFSLTRDGGFLIAGQSWDEVYNGGGYIMKANACGDRVWDTNYIFGDYLKDYHWINDAFELNNGNILATTHYFMVHDSITNFDNRFGLAMIDTVGKILWRKNFSKYYVHDMMKTIRTSDSGYLMNTYAFFPVPWDPDYYHLRNVMLKFNKDLVQEWESVYDTVNHITCNTIASAEITGQGYLSIGRVWDSLLNNITLSTFKTSLNGRVQWVKPVTESTFWVNRPVDIVKVNENLFALLAERTDKCDEFDYRSVIYTVDSTGAVLDSIVEGSAVTRAGGICTTYNGKILNLATSRPGEYFSGFFGMKFNTDLSYDTLYAAQIRYDSICDSIVSVPRINKPGSLQIRLYPVPNNGTFTLSPASGINSHFDAFIYNAQGTLLYTQHNIPSAGTNITLPGCKPGIYMVRIKSKQGMGSAKFVVL